MLRVNLLPASVRKSQGFQRITTYAVIGASVLGVVLVLLLLNLAGRIQRTDARIAQIEEASSKLADKIGYLRVLTTLEEEAGHLRDTIRGLRPAQALWIRILDELADLVRNDLWLTQLLSAWDASDRTLTLTLDGEANSKISVADFMTALEQSERFRDVRLVALAEQRETEQARIRFQLEVRVPGPEAGEAAP